VAYGEATARGTSVLAGGGPAADEVRALMQAVLDPTWKEAAA
jgi:hypothetical protein